MRPDPEQRFGIPSLSGGALRWFYGLFSVGTIYLTITNTISEVSKAEVVGWLQVQSIATEQLVRGAGASLIVSYILADGGDMVISAILRERNRRKDMEARKRAREEALKEGREEGRVRGREEGREETHALWIEWLQRREEAERLGEPFEELPPGKGDEASKST